MIFVAVSNDTSGSTYVYSNLHLIGIIPGTVFVGLDIDTVVHRLYTTNSYGNISIIDYAAPFKFSTKGLTTKISNSFNYRVIANISFTNFEYSDNALLALNPDTNMLYAASKFSNQLFITDVNNKSVVGHITLQEPAGGISLNPDTDRIYITHAASNFVSVIDCSKQNINTTIPVGNGPSTVKVDPQLNTIYVFNQGSGSFTEINGSTNRVLVGLTFDVNPRNAGHIKCSDRMENDGGTEFATNQYF